MKARILYQDDWLMAIDKPAGLAVQGAAGSTVTWMPSWTCSSSRRRNARAWSTGWIETRPASCCWPERPRRRAA
ncbi:hypothetical protein [Fodinicurvata halophila]|uniref:hypothetical protein n=1 Tax=Fodinicurvata halophila TaxID=1419723 RepID=UPI00363CF9E6